jgi:hypothetical protein
VIRRLLATVAVLTAVCVPARPAAAHEGYPGLNNVLDGVAPSLPRVTVQVVSTVADQIVVANPTATPLFVLAPTQTGEPFLRIGPGGVLANLESPMWYASNDPSNAATVPAGVDPHAPPRWSQVSAQPEWGWFDPRLPADVTPPTVPAGSSVTLAEWAIPMRYGAEAVTVHGRLRYAPPAGGIAAELQTRPPAASGLTMAVVGGGAVPAFFASFAGRGSVIVLGERGEPFLRFAASGVEANTASPTWAFAARVQGRPVGGVIDAGASPRWQLLDGSPRLSWIDPRAVYAAGTPSLQVQQRGVSTDLVRWTIPLDVNGRRVGARGVTRWVPNASALSAAHAAQRSRTTPTGSGSSRWWIAALAGAALVGSALALSAGVGIRRRRARGELDRRARSTIVSGGVVPMAKR